MVQHRGIVISKNGMVCSAHPLSSWAGADVLSRGGNAMDAIIAMALTTGVVLPNMSGLGGDAFMLFYDGKTGKVTAMNGSGRVPMRATRDYYLSKGYKSMPVRGMLSVSVPGAVSVYFKALSMFGTMKFQDLSKYAIDYAEQGFPVAQTTSAEMKADLKTLREHPSAEKTFLKDGMAYEPGEILKNPDYANTLRILNEEGEDAFYKGEIARKIVDYSKVHGGLFEPEDFQNHETIVYEPISTTYRGYTVYETAPVSQGAIVLEELNILEGFVLKSMGPDSPDAIHVMVEAKKIAFSDRIKYFGDPDFVKNPLKGIISKDYARKAMEYIRMDKTLTEDTGLSPFDFEGDTTSMVAVDRWGNAVSFIHSLSNSWGSCEVVEGTGILLNNRAGRGFNLIEGHPNCIAPWKKTMHTLNTWLITKDGRLKWVGNTPGGDGQPQWNMQLICNLIDFGMNVQEAVEAPRWLDFPGTDPVSWEKDPELRIESRISEATVRSLKNRGHNVVLLDPYGAGGAAQIIEVNKEGVMFGGSDPRADGMAIGI
ncbi:MAG: gamma-glutamyltranspeptidase / glutathione hydrolase [Thermoanaerobacteraceae bacterium]|nr:gamma-glutamyltranspeptidase / glutathione hydrolase [Thermoanaerobacteraceae bacterium]